MGQSNGHEAVPVVTVPPLSARQRDQQRAEMASQINAVILQVNTLTAAVTALRSDLGASSESFEARMTGLSRNYYDSMAAMAQMFYGRTFWQRLRWLVIGH